MKKTGKALFEELKDEYTKAYKAANGNDVVSLVWEKGFAVIGNKSGGTKVRATELPQMIENLKRAAYEDSFKAKVKEENTLTLEKLKASEEYKYWVGTSPDNAPVVVEKLVNESTAIVIQKNDTEREDLYYMYRFFIMNGKIHTSVDVNNKPASDVFDLLLTKYC
jgi:hypothetical protein